MTEQSSSPPTAKAAPPSVLTRYSLRGQADELQRLAGDQVNVLGRIAAKGQATCIYAAPNTGKTLLTLNLLMKAVEDGVVDPSKVFYIDMDDHLGGLAEKTMLAEECGFEILAGGHRDFDVSHFRRHVLDMIESRNVAGEILVLDTLKKFVDPMDKAKTRAFTSVIRKFVQLGGTVIALSHTNKKPDANGRAIYSGTTDIVDDFDCVYLVEPVSQEGDQNVVLFQNIKSRGGVVDNAAYVYTKSQDSTYSQIMASVEEVDPKEWKRFGSDPQILMDSTMIEAVRDRITAGITSKMALAKAVGAATNSGRQAAVKFIEKYTGQLWSFTRGDRGMHQYVLLEQPTV